MLPKRLERKTIYESAWINLYVDKVLMPSGHIIEKYHQLDHPHDAVAVLLLNNKNEICFIQSLRYTTQKIEWEIPSGGIDSGESILVAAEREVREETGLKVEALQHVHTYNPSNGMSNQRAHIVFGKVEEDTQGEYDTDEVQAIHWLSLDQVKELIQKNEIADGISLLPILLYLSGILSVET